MISHLLIHLLIGPLLFVLSYIFLRNPPAKPNAFYGYRTARSRKSQEAWDAANQYSSKLMLVVAVITIFVQIIGWLLWGENEKAILVPAAMMTIGLIAIIPITENYLKKHFE